MLKPFPHVQSAELEAQPDLLWDAVRYVVSSYARQYSQGPNILGIAI